MRFSLFFTVFFWVAGFVVSAQDVPDAPPPISEDKEIERLRALVPALEDAQAYLEDLRKQAEAMDTPEDRAEINKLVDTQRERVVQLRENFRTLATGVENDRYLSKAEESVSWQENLEDIIAPISNGVRELTAGPREMDELRKELALWKDRRDLSAAALGRIDELIALADSEVIKEELESARKLWASRSSEAESQFQVFSQQIEEREANSPTTWEAVSGAMADFWRSKGMNLIIALVASVGVFFLTRALYRQFKRVSPVHRRKRNSLATRSADLLAAILSVVFAILAAVAVFYFRGDWLLLTLSAVFIVGVLWASKQAIPPYIEQIKMILNIGSVRQGERLIYNGIPWRVDRLNFFCDFTNPNLMGGHLRLPVRDVMPLHSRESDPKEPWFPTKRDDWIKLSDETYGKVVEQTPEQVVVLRLGGSRKTYPTIDFLEQCPENLSYGFRVSATFGIDYDHQSIATTTVPDIFLRALEKELVSRFGHENVRSVKVEFSSAGASSLDYRILADFAGDVASRVNVIERSIQRVCVNVCNEQEWGIPFTQITVHQAGDAVAAAST
ncbi:hypothetical protein [Haloferula sp.]|uniref:hypothetical protein n=1 Tax=Haloferula sp. TaxID=2497595 RepID=UPI003C71EA3E